MDHRGQESPMDFQWENSSGRVDPNSPFRMSGIERTIAKESPVKRDKNSIFQSSPIKQPVFTAPATPHQKHSAMPQFHTPAFLTPRNGFDSPSKDSDVFSTPGDSRDTDSEAPTPENLAHLFRSGKKAGIGALSLTPGRFPGRGELRRGKHHEGAISKPRRRRPRKTGLDRISDDEEESEQDEDYATRIKSPRKSRKGQSIAEDWLNTHQHVPAVVSEYLRLFVHASWVALVIYILFSCFVIVREDMQNRVQEASDEVLAQIAVCKMNYIQNRCAPDFRVPAMEQSCATWEKCMNQDPTKVGRAKVSVTMIAEILNGFVNELHWKTLGLISLLVTGCWAAGNLVTSKITTHNPQSTPPLFVPQSHWTPHPPMESHRYQQQEPWSSPLAKKKGLPSNYKPMQNGDSKSLKMKLFEQWD